MEARTVHLPPTSGQWFIGTNVGLSRGSTSSNEPLPQEVVERALRPLALPEEIVERRAFVFGGGQEIFETLPLIALQADPERGQDRGMRLRESLRHLDLGQRLFGPRQEPFVICALVVAHRSRPFGSA